MWVIYFWYEDGRTQECIIEPLEEWGLHSQVAVDVPNNDHTAFA
jgi:hypothetical protein